MKNKHFIFILLVVCIITTFLIILILDENHNQTTSNKDNIIESGENAINLTINGTNLNVNLENNATTTALLELLPLEISMSELNGNEKYYYLSESLPTNAEEVGTIHAGNIMLYGDDCLVIFYETFETNYRYTKIGHIANHEDLKELLGSGNITVRWDK